MKYKVLEQVTYMMIWIWCLICVVFLLMYFKNYINGVKLAFRLPGPPALYFFGNIFQFNDFMNGIEMLSTEYKDEPILRLWGTIKPYFILNDPKYIRTILNNDTNTKKPDFFCDIMRSVSGEGLIVKDGHEWRKSRKHVNPLFGTAQLNSLIAKVSNCANEVVISIKTNEDVNIVNFVNNYVLKLSWELILGVPSRNDKEEIEQRKQTLRGFNTINYWLALKHMWKVGSLSPERLSKKSELHQFIKKLLQEEGDDLKDGLSFLDRLKARRIKYPNFTQEDITVEVATLIFASFDTTRSAATFALYLLAKHQDVQDRVFEELTDVFGNNLDTNITSDDLNKLVYLEQCIKESLRFYPTIPILMRMANEDIVLDEFYTLPKGSQIFICPFMIHRLPRLFPDPLKFDPDRFSTENIRKIELGSYIPFSIGPRNCIGHKYALSLLKTFTASLLRRYKLVLSPKQKELKLKFNVSVTSRGGLHVRLIPRNQDLSNIYH